MSVFSEQNTRLLTGFNNIKAFIESNAGTVTKVGSSPTIEELLTAMSTMEMGGGATLAIRGKVAIGSGSSFLTITCDTWLKPTLTLADFNVSSQITAVTYMTPNTVRFNVTNAVIGTSYSIQVKASAYLYNNGDSEILTGNVVEAFFNPILGTTAGMTDLNFTSDDGTANFTMPSATLWQYNGAAVTQYTISGNSFVIVGNNINFNNRDGRLTACYVQYVADGAVEYIKIAWNGYGQYNQADDQRWELYLFPTGDAMIYATSFSVSYNSGAYNFFGTTYTVNANQRIATFYRQNVAGTSWVVDYSLYDSAKSLRLM